MAENNFRAAYSLISPKLILRESDQSFISANYETTRIKNNSRIIYI